ncbi:hypothetical protein PVAP13_7KG109155 [Panicum virgatum]|uniref:Uncharacterized protein n=1 Tax=Panicum virgatum TaxID=38727 RepID=A0A8T0QDD9_PANVG|nr:hypothetical protein PVAP13_7KG109155 [Panicum virgatum]
MFRGGGRGGGRGRGRGGGRALMDDVDAQQLGIHFHQEVGLPLGNRTRRSIPNILVLEPDIKRVHISFQIPVRHIEWSLMVPGQDPSSIIPMVSIAAVVERHTFGQLMRG